MSEQHLFIIDDFTRRRGEPAMLRLQCAACHTYIMTYQKDGPGPLLRCYWDRIHAPVELTHLRQEAPPRRLNCPCCAQPIGSQIMYEKEQRPAFHLVEGSVELLNEAGSNS